MEGRWTVPNLGGLEMNEALLVEALSQGGARVRPRTLIECYTR